ncbi:type II secretion system F family protein [Gluconacetobacter azotocaptans]|uniref:Type II secretion system F family protein n=1 Tax=Gluconacetobacter azotocaptans TaxID=142834 RepID=A0A7W4JVV9_9PROT|nr:type II secretion system F family protein [Gluconacetobacter azotocaptans]MBB2191735.1 type II secretion system F family protein [Gluconacetobacter azotocaptans]GBQ34223.1 Flp pilus assembly protein TadC [Gluconacetobacter azotocaptans DSM 13594]
MNRVLLAGGFVSLMLVMTTAVAGMVVLERRRRFQERVRLLHDPDGRVAPTAGIKEFQATSIRAVAGIGQWIVKRGLLSTGTLAELRESLASTGVQGTNAVSLFIGAKILLATILPVLAIVLLPRVFSSISPLVLRVLPAGVAIVGLLLPDYVLRAWRNAYLKQLEAGLPDALDVMVICTQAGVGLGPAIVQVGVELEHANPAVAGEFTRTANELGIIADTRLVLSNLGSRSGLDGFKRLAATLLQTQQYGTPITDALRALSVELRHEMLTRYEAGAARLGVLLTLPTLLFIMPCVFLIAGGPAAIQVMRAFVHHH